MTPSINLLPWREWRRQRRNRIFLAQLAAVLAAGFTLLAGFGQQLGGAIQAQQSRNAMLRDQGVQLDQRIAEVQALRQQRQKLVQRIRSIQALEAQRFGVLSVLNALAAGLPDGLHYESMQLQDAALTLKGVATQADSVSELLRSLQASSLFRAPRLISIDDAGAFHISAGWRGGCPSTSSTADHPNGSQPCR